MNPNDYRRGISMRRRAEHALHELNQNNYGIDGEVWRAGVFALVMLDSELRVPVALARKCMIPLSEVKEYLQRMRDNGILQGDILHINWFEEEVGRVAFLLDLLVLTGQLVRSSPKMEDTQVVDNDPGALFDCTPFEVQDGKQAQETQSGDEVLLL